MIADDPKEIAAILIEENGADHALDIAVAEITHANQICDYYSLSVWREIRNIVRDKMAPTEKILTGEPADRELSRVGTRARTESADFAGDRRAKPPGHGRVQLRDPGAARARQHIPVAEDDITHTLAEIFLHGVTGSGGNLTG